MNILTAGNALSQNQYLNNANYYLLLQNDCNLVLYNSSTFMNNQSIWSTNSTNQGNNSCTLQVDTGGFLSIYNASTSRDLSQCYNQTNNINCVPWSAQPYATGSGEPFFIMLTGNGTLEVYDFQNGYPKGVFWIYTNSNASNGVVPYPNDVTPGQISSYPPPNNSSPTPPSSLSVYGPYWDFVTQEHPFNVSYMPRGYYLSEGSLSNGLYSLTMEDNCTLKIISPNSSRNLSTPGNSHCVLTLQQNGTLQLQTNDTHEFVSNIHPASGDVNVDWILYLDETGFLYIRDLLNPSIQLWNNTGANTGAVKNSNNNVSLIGILVGVIGGVLSIVIISVIRLYYAHASGMDPVEKELQRRLQKKGGTCQVFTLATLKQATTNFGKILGGGGFGEVFYGKLPDGQEVAVKTLSASSHQSKQEFFNEIELLSMVHHKYLVSLIGYCLAPNNYMLVYEYMSGGDLRNRLHGENAMEKPLTWRQRTTIILQVAEGIEYLHDKCSPAIIHRDIKTTNILLTTNMVAKVADFGLSKLRAMEQGDASHITTNVKGTAGYVDPEYHQSGMLTNKSDVYAFGIVMMEILTAQSHLAITRKVSEAWKSKHLNGLADPNMEGNFDKQEFSDLVKLSLWCAEMAGNDRPSMPQVVQALRDCGIDQMESQEYNPKSDVKRNSIPDIAKFAAGLHHEKETTRPLFSTATSLSSSTSQSTNNGVSNPLLTSSSNRRMIEISEIFSNILPR